MNGMTQLIDNIVNDIFLKGKICFLYDKELNFEWNIFGKNRVVISEP